MQTHLADFIKHTPRGKIADKILQTCVHCGFCTATCPTYVLLGDELDSPRGRIYLIKDMLENGRAADAEIVTHVDRCLSCLSCMTTCAVKVDYAHLIDIARNHIERHYRRPLAERMLRVLLAKTLPYPRRFAAAMRLGVVGDGELGQSVAAIGRALGMRVLFSGHKGRTGQGRLYTPFEQLLGEADVLTLHCPLNERTHHMISTPEFALMKRRPLLINTGRGGLVDEAAVGPALNAGEISGAAFDVTSVEPPPADHPFMALLDRPDFILTPHVAWASEEAIQALAERGANARKTPLIDTTGPMHDERRKHLEARVMQHPVLDGKQQIVQRTIDASRPIVGFPAAGGDDQHGALAGHAAFAVAIAPVAVGVLADAVGEAIGIDPVDPSLEYRRHREPPQRKLQDERIGPPQLVLLAGDIEALTATGIGAPRGLRGIEAR